jgi:hypothetical protein
LIAVGHQSEPDYLTTPYLLTVIPPVPTEFARHGHASGQAFRQIRYRLELNRNVPSRLTLGVGFRILQLAWLVERRVPAQRSEI